MKILVISDKESEILTDTEMTRRLNRVYQRIKSKGHIDIVIAHYPALGIGDGQDKAHTGFFSN